MRYHSFLFATAMIGLSCVPAAHADSFMFSFGTPGVTSISGSGTLDGSQNPDGSYLITSVVGTSDAGEGVTQPITSIEQPGTYESNDNLLFSDGMGGYSFDFNGLSYMLNDGAQINIIFTAAEETLLPGQTDSNSYAEPVTITANTPEPSSFALLGTGLLGVAGMARRRFQV